MTKQIKVSEPDAFREFNDQIVSHLPQLRRQAMALTRHKADAEDLLQTAVTSAIMARDSFTPGTNFKAWITCILRNRFLSNIRQRRFHVDLGDVPEGLLGRDGQQESHLDMMELRRQIQRLSSDQRTILMMISADGMSYDEASEELGVAAGTLKCRVFRARAQLEAWMYGQEHSVKPKLRTAQRVTVPPAYTLPAPVRQEVSV